MSLIPLRVVLPDKTQCFWCSRCSLWGASSLPKIGHVFEVSGHIGLDKVGNQPVADFKKLDISEKEDKFAGSDTDESFAIAQFQNKSDAEKLSSPAFEPLKGGVALTAADSGGFKTGLAVRRMVRYETIILDTQYKRYVQEFVIWIGSLFAHFFSGSVAFGNQLAINTMEGLYVYPGHEIQLAWQPTLARSVKLQVVYREKNINPGNNGLDFIVTDVTHAVTVQISDGNQNVRLINFNALNNTVSLINSASHIADKNYINFEYTAPSTGIVHTVNIEVSVHLKMLNIWPGNASIIVPLDDRLFHSQISVFALFDTFVYIPDDILDINVPTRMFIEEDVTGHGYATFQVLNNVNNLELDSEKRGRIKGKALGQTSIQVTDPITSKTELVEVFVINFYGNPLHALDPSTINQPNVILQQISNPQTSFRKKDKFTYSDDPAERLNILFLSEGYTDAQAPIFDDMVNSLVNDIFSSYRPFHLLRHRFNIWKAFLPSPEPGWTYQHFVSTVYKTYLNPNTYNNNPNQLEGRIEVKNTNLGLIYSPVRASDQYLLDPQEDIIIGDRRRYPLELDWTKAILRHIWSFSDGKTMRGDTWYKTSINNTDAEYTKDFGLVVILVNASNDWREGAFAEGANFGSFVVIPAPVGGNSQLKRPNLDRAIVSEFPGLLSPDKYALFNYDYLKTVFLRFFTKRFDLGYEFNVLGQQSGNRVSALSGNNTNSSDSIGHVMNDTYPTNFSTAIKWNLLDRVVKSDRIIDIVQVSASGATKVSIKLKLASKSVKARWKGEKTRKEPVWIREFRVSSDRAESRMESERYGFDYHSEELLDFSNHNYYHIPRNHWTYNPDVQTRDPELFVFNQFIIKGFDGADVLVLEADINAFTSLVAALTPVEIEKFLRLKLSTNGFFNGLLYKPLVKDNAVEKLIRTDVRTRLESNIQYNLNILPPPASGLSTTSLPKGREFEYPPPTLVKTGASLKAQPLIGNKFPFLVVGSYLGSYDGEFAAYRPTGACLMRNFDKKQGIYFNEFCFVCQYLIVSYVDPAQLETLEKDYPDFAI